MAYRRLILSLPYLCMFALACAQGTGGDERECSGQGCDEPESDPLPSVHRPSDASSDARITNPRADAGVDAAASVREPPASDGGLRADASLGQAADAGHMDGGSVGAPTVDAGRDAATQNAGTDAGSVPVTITPTPVLPSPRSTCPEFVEGTATFAGSPVRLWVGSDGESKRGPVIFYWYATGASVDEVWTGLGSSVVAEVKQLGGMIAALERTTEQGTNTGNGVWYTGDFAIADEVLACAIQKRVGIDLTHIHAAGFSAGGLQTSWMAYALSNYLASVVSYSGGLISTSRTTSTTADTSNVVPAMMVHGEQGEDRFIIDFANTSAAMTSDIRQKGGFALDCTHQEGHRIPANIGPWAFRFMKDHPYKRAPSPYLSAMPAGFPSYCTAR